VSARVRAYVNLNVCEDVWVCAGVCVGVRACVYGWVCVGVCARVFVSALNG